MSIIKASEIPHYYKVLVYGDSGHGKTTFAASGSEHDLLKDTLLINVDGGITSVKGRPNLDISDRITRTSELDDIFWKLAGKTEGYEKYKTVIIDSGTEFQALNLAEVVQKASGSRTNGAEMIDYKKSNEQLQKIFRQFRDLPMNVIITAQVKRDYPPPPATLGERKAYHNIPTYIGPQFPSALARSVISYMDAVWYCYLEDGQDKPRLLTAPEGVVRIKTRGERFSKKLDKIIINPNFAEIFELYLKEEKYT